MPDIITVISRRWKLILLLSLVATAIAFFASLLSPKLYVGEATALPVNTVVNDKARIFNDNIEALYSETGTPDELDKLEGTAKLDTIFMAAVIDFNLPHHYKMDTNAVDVSEKAVLALKKNSDISRTGFGELKVKVWDKDNAIAASLANALMQNINEVHQRVQRANSEMVLQKLKEDVSLKQKELAALEQGVEAYTTSDTFSTSTTFLRSGPTTQKKFGDASKRSEFLTSQVKSYQKIIDEYELAAKLKPNVLMVVEHARPSPWTDKPKTMQTVFLAFLASLFFSFLLAFFVESRMVKA
jgi:uncharacterized protein involved in exopolysaccharide biosynthesis